jgi:hypothetical protein
MAEQSDEDNRSTEHQMTADYFPSPKNRFKFYTAQFEDDGEYMESIKKLTGCKRSRHELEIHLEIELPRRRTLIDGDDNPLISCNAQKS